MNYIILAAVLSVVLYYIIAATVCRLKERSLRRRVFTGVLVAALLVSQTNIVNVFVGTEAATVAAAEQEAESGADAEETVEARNTEVRTVTAFAELPDDIREQAVPVGTALEELVLPDTLEAVCDAVGADTEDDTDTSDSDVGGGASEDEDDVDDETSNDENDADDETSNGENNADDVATDEEDEAPESSEDDSKEETPSEEEVNDETESPTEKDGTKTEPSTGDEETAETAVRTETGSFVMPEYHSEHIVEIKTLEDDSQEGEADAEPEVINSEKPSEDSESEADSDTSEISQETIIIENITWQSEPEYDGDTEGEYIFTAVLPEGYVLTNEVNAPQITVTVGGTNNIMLLSDGGNKDNWPRSPYKEDPDDRYMTLDCVYFGHYWYHDTNSDDEVDQSDKKEPIKWQVLSVDESGDAFLLADKIVDVQPYNKTNKADVTWENCTLRSWLNGYGSGANGENEDYSGDGMSFFDNAFSEEEKSAILETKVENGDDPDEEGTRDKVYLLSISEVTNSAYGFSASKSSSYDSRSAYSTEYARSAPWVFEEHWYLRSMADQGGYSDPAAALIDDDGKVCDEHKGYSMADAIGVRPVLHLNLNKDAWVPACPVQGKNRVLHRSFGPWHSHPWWEDYHEHICADETCVRLDPYNSSANEPCSGGTAGYTKKAICAVCGNEYGALLTDDTPPTGTISIDIDQWNDVQTDFTFEKFYKESIDVTISAEDGESGVASISYYLTDRKLTKDDLEDIEDWLPTDADYEEADDWKTADTVTVTIDPDIKSIFYARIVDGGGNATYLSTDGMILDGTAPKIEGVEDGGTYCAPRGVTVTVTDDYLDSVTLNGESVALSTDGTSCTFTLSKAEPSLTIKAADKAGNSTTVTVTVNEDHVFGEWDESVGKNRSKTCENCGQKYTETDEERLKAAKEIVEEFLGNLSAPEDMGEDDLRQMVEGKLAREGFSDVTVTVDEFHKEESSGQTEGRIWGDVTLELREASEDVDFDMPLENDRQRVQRAKEVVEKTLSEMTVSNDTTAEDIQDAIDTALKDAGLEDVTATVGDDFNIEEATEESAGRITGTVTLEKGKETDEVEIDKKIGKPEQTPNASVDRPNGRIKDLVPGAEYDITYKDKDGKQHTDTVTADKEGNLEIEDEWTGGTVDIVKKGNGDGTADSPPQSLDIPEREPAPSDAGMSKKAGKDGKGGSIGGLTPGETYQISKDGGETWEDVTADGDGEIKPVEAGSYDIRKKAGDNTLPSKPVHVQVTKEKSGSSGGSGSGGSGSGDDGSNSGGNDSDNGGSTGGDGSSGSGDDSGNSNGGQTPGGGNGGTDSGTGTGTQPGTGDTADTGNTAGTGGTGNKGDAGNQGGTGNTGSTGNTDKADRTTGGDGDGKEHGSTGSSAGGELGSSSSGGADAETPDGSSHTVQAELENGEIVISGGAGAGSAATGAAIATGTIGTAQSTTTTLTVGEGAVTVTVDSDGYRSVAGVTDTVAVANAVLTPEQKQRVNDGGKISVRVEVKDISGQVSQQDKDIIESGLVDYKITGDMDREGELTLGAYIDISMYIRVDDGDWDAVTHSDEPIEVVIGIPDELQSDGRTYYIARAHEGNFSLLDDLDSEPDTITIMTELFSTYAIVFRQMLGTGAGADASSGFPASLSWTAVALWSLGILVMLGLAIFLIFWKRRKDGGEAA